MKKVFALILSAVIIISAAGCGSKAEEGSNEQETTAQASKAETLGEEVKKQLDQALDDVEYSGVVQITKNGDVIYTYVNGDDSNGKPLTAGASLPVGSVSKQFCAACVMYLCEQNKLSLEDTLDRFFPNFKDGKKITVKQLLNMSSGLTNYLEFLKPTMVTDNESENISAITKLITDQTPRFEPGQDYEYSNSNYFLLAAIVEQAGGIAYHKFLREQFFVPLEMNDTGFIEEIPDAEWASALSADELKNEYLYRPGVTRGAGDVVSNAADMEKWMRGLSEGKVISVDSFRQMTESVNPYSDEEYCFGLWHMPFGGFGHVGQIPPSFGAVDYINTERGICLFAVANYGRGMSYVQQLPDELLEILFDEKSE